MGIAVETFVDDPVNANFICAICHSVLDNAVSCRQGHLFCDACIRTWLSTRGEQKTCPCDRSPLLIKQLVPCLVVRNLISSLTVRCPNSKAYRQSETVNDTTSPHRRSSSEMEVVDPLDDSAEHALVAGVDERQAARASLKRRRDEEAGGYLPPTSNARSRSVPSGLSSGLTQTSPQLPLPLTTSLSVGDDLVTHFTGSARPHSPPLSAPPSPSPTSSPSHDCLHTSSPTSFSAFVISSSSPQPTGLRSAFSPQISSATFSPQIVMRAASIGSDITTTTTTAATTTVATTAAVSSSSCSSSSSAFTFESFSRSSSDPITATPFTISSTSTTTMDTTIPSTPTINLALLPMQASILRSPSSPRPFSASPGNRTVSCFTPTPDHCHRLGISSSSPSSSDKTYSPRIPALSPTSTVTSSDKDGSDVVRMALSPERAAFCDWIGQLEHLDAHLAKCPYALVRCKFCRHRTTRVAIKQHQKLCAFREVECEFCLQTIPWVTLSQHVRSDCPGALVQCVNRCVDPNRSPSVEHAPQQVGDADRDRVEETLSDPGGSPVSPAPDSVPGAANPATDTEAFSPIRMIKRRDMELHLSTECPFTPTPCAFHEFGCSKLVRRQELARHMSDNMGTHLEMMAKTNRSLETTVKRLQSTVNELRESVSVHQEFVWKLMDPALESKLTSSIERVAPAPTQNEALASSHRILSNVFVIGGVLWQMTLYPRGVERDGWVCVLIKPLFRSCENRKECEHVCSVEAAIEITLVTHTHNLLSISKRGDFSWTKHSDSRKGFRFLPCSQLKTLGFLSNNTMYIRAKITNINKGHEASYRR